MALNTYDTNDNLKSSKVNSDFEKVANGTEMHYNAEWTTYTPTWTATTSNPAIGNGTLSGRYLVIGNTVFVRIFLLWGSTTTTGSGVYLWALPFIADTNIGSTHLVFGDGQVHDITGNLYYCWVRQHSTYKNRVQMVLGTASGTYVQQDTQVGTGGSAPVTFATGDTLTMTFAYEKASS